MARAGAFVRHARGTSSGQLVTHFAARPPANEWRRCGSSTCERVAAATRRQSIVPGDEPGDNNRSRRLAIKFGDDPDRPRDPDLFDADEDSQREFRQRFIPSGVAREVFLNAFERLASFEPHEHNLTQRLLKGYKAAITTVDTNGDGIVSAEEGDVDTPNPNCPQKDNSCIFLPTRSFNRFAVTREINDGLLAPRFAPSTRGWVLSGTIVTGFPVVPASEGEDADDR